MICMVVILRKSFHKMIGAIEQKAVFRCHFLSEGATEIEFQCYGLNCVLTNLYQFSSVQSLSRVRLLATPWIAAPQASLSITNSRSSLRLTSIESVMDREAWRAAIHGVTKSGTWLRDWTELNWATELNWTEVRVSQIYLSAYINNFFNSKILCFCSWPGLVVLNWKYT